MNGLVLGAKKGSGGGHPIPAHAQRKQFEKMQAEQSAKHRGHYSGVSGTPPPMSVSPSMDRFGVHRGLSGHSVTGQLPGHASVTQHHATLAGAPGSQLPVKPGVTTPGSDTILNRAGEAYKRAHAHGSSPYGSSVGSLSKRSTTHSLNATYGAFAPGFDYGAPPVLAHQGPSDMHSLPPLPPPGTTRSPERTAAGRTHTLTQMAPLPPLHSISQVSPGSHKSGSPVEQRGIASVMMGARPGRQLSNGNVGADNFSQESPRPLEPTPGQLPTTGFPAGSAYPHHSLTSIPPLPAAPPAWHDAAAPPQAGAENPHYAAGLAGLAQDRIASESRLHNQMIHQEESMVVRIKTAKRAQHRARMLHAILSEANPSPGRSPQDIYASHQERISAQIQRYAEQGAYDPQPRPPVNLATASAKDLLMRNMDIEQEAVMMEKEQHAIEAQLRKLESTKFGTPSSTLRSLPPTTAPPPAPLGNDGYDLVFRGTPTEL